MPDKPKKEFPITRNLKIDEDGIILNGPQKGQKLKSKSLLKLIKHLKGNPDA